ncbi:sulfurtransferase [Roseovarius sp. A21]|uniref:Sulfurtransferase n=1 Tax=Roseovarius bejariae TaxID=2576383 RepID=A0A844CTL8_9RHOB|nr:rhodanese-like domain-containing protein [Roseovarius bejariae]MRU14030.1 sulfurtransferase [Roseovarius bejariae]
MTFPRILTASALALALVLPLGTAGFADNHGAMIETSVNEADLPKKKTNEPGNYITAAESIALLKERDDVALIDIRSPEETMFVGYATETDANIPFMNVDPAHIYNPKKSSYKMMPNDGFVDQIKGYVAANNPSALLIICRSGGRSAKAVDMLAKAGVETPGYTVVDGFEGDKSDAGTRAVNGWKNAGGEWTYKVTEDLLAK